ncbi:MAG: GIY-YIG nuclease family protein [Aigarchaeota archaeon]|nr:GIY-YIG nuclease family protein [Candidatus Pelearchaeum maunauluense]
MRRRNIRASTKGQHPPHIFLHQNPANLPDSGSYVIIIALKQTKTLKIGSLGKIKLTHGYYAYAGSAKRALRARITRHLRHKKKRKHWHIDTLTSLPSTHIRAIACNPKPENECKIAAYLIKKMKNYVRGFGSTDCKCPSHLAYSTNYQKLIKAVKMVVKNS